MGNDKVKLNKDAINFDFLEKDFENDTHVEDSYYSNYKILIADDEEEVHKMTKLVLKGFEIEGTKLQFYDTYSGEETIEFLNKNEDIAIILLDVVMEEDDSGLRVVKYLRENLRNNITRIILRTGQPGKAPENKVIIEYEIDDYKSKTELTVQKLYSTMYVCLRAHKNIKALNSQKEGLQKVIRASQNLFKYHSFTDFLNGMLLQVISLYDMDLGSLFIRNESNTIDGLAVIEMMDSAKILAATGKYQSMVGKAPTTLKLNENLYKIIEQIEESKESELIIRQGGYLGIYKQSSDKQIKNYIIIEAPLDTDNLEMVKLFLTNFSLAIDNFIMNIRMNESQNEIIQRISEVVENRSSNTGSHLKKVLNVVKLLSRKLGYNEEEAASISLASVMHDVGKIGIPDAILLKPARLTHEEFEIMKTHCIIGYNIFKDSKLKILDLAADIALGHHERYDGAGYPMGKKGEEIPKECQIVSAADVFDALVSKRCYKEPWPQENVIEYFKENRGKQFAPEVVDMLMENIDEILNIISSFPD